MDKVTLSAYAAPAQSDQNGGDHVCVASSDGKNWGCFGRDLAGMQGANPKQVAQGQAYSRWAELIVASDEAGVVNQVSGRCHNVANRILALAGTDVRTAGADALVMFYYGKYGFNVATYIDRVKSAAAQVNAEAPNTLSIDNINGVIALINQAQEDELEILQEYFQMDLTPDQKVGFAQIYGEYCAERDALEGDVSSYDVKIKPIAVDTLKKLQKVLGPDNYMRIFKKLPQSAIDSING